MRRRIRRLVRLVARGTFVAVALVGFVAAQVGFPMTLPSGSSQARPCGCQVEDDCQKCCCCATPEASCCQTQAPTCKAPAEPEPDACPLCRAESPPPPVPPERSTPAQTEWVIGSLMQHCHGAQTCWITLGAVLPPAAHVCVSADPCLRERIILTDAFARPHTAAPLEPPPRFPSV